MSIAQFHIPVTDTVAPDEYAMQVAEDRGLAARYHLACTLDDRAGAHRLVAAEADEILALCTYTPVTRATAVSVSLVHSMGSIDEVASRSEVRGDTVQVTWCRTLNHWLREALGY